MPDLTTLLGLLREGIRVVPVVKYAMGLAAIAAAVAIARGLFPDVGLPAMLPLLVGAMIAMAILATLAAALERHRRFIRQGQREAMVDHPAIVGTVLLWAICAFVIIFMSFTVTAVAAGWPSQWARILLPEPAAETSLASKIGGDSPALADPEPVSPTFKPVRPNWTIVNDDWPMAPGEVANFKRVQSTVLRECGACLKMIDETTVAPGGVSHTTGSRISVDARTCRRGVRLALRALKVMQAPNAPMAVTTRYARVDIPARRITHILVDDVINFEVSPIACL